ncbi:MAG: hypothetical protein QOJ64_490 [Acidobacteriota bacterium]|nr:hypothetical protein [Acidobacteriota bacterium]
MSRLRRFKVCAFGFFLIASTIVFVSTSAEENKRPVVARRVAVPAHTRKITRSGSIPTADQCKNAPKYPLPLPSSLNQKDFINFDQTLYDFLNCGNYKNLGWHKDKRVRDTGPFINNRYYGTHPAVRIFYSPEVIDWLNGGRAGEIHEGAMIIKEQYTPPSPRYDGMDEKALDAAFAKMGKDWTVMIRDPKGSKDGWYWAEVYSGFTNDATSSIVYPFGYPNGGFGQYCLRCHTSADKEHTFSALNNIDGFPGEPVSFRIDNSWRNVSASEKPVDTEHQKEQQLPADEAMAVETNEEFLETFKSIANVPFTRVQQMPSEAYDRVVSGPKGPEEFLSSDQCMMCHSAATGAYGPIMFLQTGPLPPSGPPPGINVSPYGEWRWSPMGLAGRDPIFYSQFESEVAFLKTIKDKKTSDSLMDSAVNTCFRCHGVMGKRQFDIDHNCDPTDPTNPCNPADPSRPQFKPEFVNITDASDPNFKYGSLARDGISCAACHHTQRDKQPPGSKEPPLTYFLKHSITGLFQTGKPDEVVGPFKDDVISPYAMDNALGIKPKFDDYMKSSRMCGSCHTIYLPIVDRPPIQPVGPDTKYNMEQATYLEWLNSKYQDEFKPIIPCGKQEEGLPPLKPCAQSCQDCHMPGGYHNKDLNVPQVQTQIAVIEDTNYPAADGRAPLDKINVRFRDKDYVRHEFLGANMFLLQMFSQFDNVLGVRLSDYMSSTKLDLPTALDNVAQQVQERSAKIETTIKSADPQKIVADVKVSNLTGHRFPSGVGFRRAFIEFVVSDTSEGQSRVVWASGRTNELGIIVDGDGNILPSEFFTEYRDKNGQLKQRYQEHYEVVDSQDHVQIYEELTQNFEEKFTSSFIRRDHVLKDNRLLPTGWTRKGPDPATFNGPYLEATFPEGLAAEDPLYMNGSGTDVVRYVVTLPKGLDPTKLTVRATLYYQSIPPFYLNMRFTEAPDGPATRRLYYLASNLNLAGTPIENWKLKVVSTNDQPVVMK